MAWALTPPSSGQPPACFAHLRSPLMSNVSRHMHTAQSWFEHKLAGPCLRLREEARATEEWKRFTGRNHFAKLTLLASPAESFSLQSAPAAWPSEADREEYEPYIVDGVLSELMLGPGFPVLGLRVVVESAVTHETESNGLSFFQAAKLATAKLLAGASGRYRANCTNGG